MKKEERVGEICKESMDILGKSLSEAVAHAVSEGYKLGFEECLKHFGINKEE